jgi:hypothetical protein
MHVPPSVTTDGKELLVFTNASTLSEKNSVSRSTTLVVDVKISAESESISSPSSSRSDAKDDSESRTESYTDDDEESSHDIIETYISVESRAAFVAWIL